MLNRQVAIAFPDYRYILTYIKKGELAAYLKYETNVHGRLLYTLRDYLVEHLKKFDFMKLVIHLENRSEYSKGTLPGYIRKINQSKADIGIMPFTMTETITKFVDFSYPYQIYYGSFMTRKQENKPQIFSILKTFSLSTWLVIFLVFFTMLYLYYASLKKRHSLDKILLHVFGVLLRQESIMKTSSMGEKLMVYAWVFGTMFLCLAYESVFFSFLAIPSVSQIKDVSQLAKAVKKENYHCIADPTGGVYERLLQSQEGNLKIIGTDLRKNNLSYIENAYENVYRISNKRNIAFLSEMETIRALAILEDYISDDRFLEFMPAIVVRKNFCCKKLVETFVHKMLASGIYSKYLNDRAFMLRLPRLLKYKESYANKRKLTLKDLAPAFIILLTGYFISFLLLIEEKMVNRRKKIYSLKK